MKPRVPILPVLVLCLVAPAARPAAADPSPAAGPKSAAAAPDTPKAPAVPRARRRINYIGPYHPFYRRPLSPEEVAKFERADEARQDGDAALRAGNAAWAEARYRDSLAEDPDGETYFSLAEALTAQGKIQDALQTYGTLFNPGPSTSYGGSYMTRAGLRYALLLNQTGQWAEALRRYQDALIDLPGDDGGDSPKVNIAFDPDVPHPVALAAAVNLALGLNDNFTFTNNGRGDGATLCESDRAFQEYAQALKLEPDWDVANYYYGYGWQQLSPASQKRLGSVQQAKAALLKAVRVGRGSVKKAAQKALLVAMNVKVKPK